MIAYYMPSILLNALYLLFYLFLQIIPRCTYYYLHFIGMKFRMIEVNYFPRAQCGLAVEAGSNSSQYGFRTHWYTLALILQARWKFKDYLVVVIQHDGLPFMPGSLVLKLRHIYQKNDLKKARIMVAYAKKWKYE